MSFRSLAVLCSCSPHPTPPAPLARVQCCAAVASVFPAPSVPSHWRHTTQPAGEQFIRSVPLLPIAPQEGAHTHTHASQPASQPASRTGGCLLFEGGGSHNGAPREPSCALRPPTRQGGLRAVRARGRAWMQKLTWTRGDDCLNRRQLLGRQGERVCSLLFISIRIPIMQFRCLIREY